MFQEIYKKESGKDNNNNKIIITPPNQARTLAVRMSSSLTI
jgi:hypothetical protein